MKHDGPHNLYANDPSIITDEYLAEMRARRDVQGLELKRCRKVTSKELASLAGKFPDLRALTLDGRLGICASGSYIATVSRRSRE